jgi:hypothetical protein
MLENLARNKHSSFFLPPEKNVIRLTRSQWSWPSCIVSLCELSSSCSWTSEMLHFHVFMEPLLQILNVWEKDRLHCELVSFVIVNHFHWLGQILQLTMKSGRYEFVMSEFQVIFGPWRRTNSAQPATVPAYRTSLGATASASRPQGPIL